MLNIFFGLAIGFPLLSFNTLIEKFGIVSVLAPLGEELLFGCITLLILFAVFRNTNKLILIGINGLIFMGFHFIAYGASFAAANASFIGALIYRVLADNLILNQKDDMSTPAIPIAGIVAHVIINTYLVIKITGLVIVGV